MDSFPHGIYRWTKDDVGDFARVQVSPGEWTDLSKADYDAQQIEPNFWALREYQSWLEFVTAGAAGGGTS